MIDKLTDRHRTKNITSFNLVGRNNVVSVCFVKSNLHSTNYIGLIQFYSAITSYRVLNGELYAQKLQKLFFLQLYTDCFMKM